MAWPSPKYPRSQVNKVGDILRDGPTAASDHATTTVLGNWRSSHGYPINTFQATLREKLKRLGFEDVIVAQRLKRAPSIIAKLQRYPGMQLARMQDIGGLRAVVSDLDSLRVLEQNYNESRFQHSLVGHRDYIQTPKSSGYRGIHLVYKYKNPRAPDYDGLRVELQLRSYPQHVWATAVETVGTLLQQALKASDGEAQWLKFFQLAGSAFAHLEGTQPVERYKDWSKIKTYTATLRRAKELDLAAKFITFVAAVGPIETDKRPGTFRLVELDLTQRRVRVRTFARKELDHAESEYADIEREISSGKNLQAVLVGTGPLKELRRAYPNYFLEIKGFIEQLNRMREAIREMDES